MGRCKYCNKTVDLEKMGVSGKYKKKWTYCDEHHEEAIIDRDSFLMEKIGKKFDEVITPPLFENEKLDDIGT